MMAWSLGRRETLSDPSRHLAAAVKRLKAPWAVLCDVCIETAQGRVALDYILVHPACGVAVIDAAETAVGGALAVDALRKFLKAGEFETFFPGYLPIVPLCGAAEAPTDLTQQLADAFANAPLLTIREDGWAAALATVVGSAEPGGTTLQATAPPSQDAPPNRPRPIAAPLAPPETTHTERAFGLYADPTIRVDTGADGRGRLRWMVGALAACTMLVAASLLWQHRLGADDSVASHRGWNIQPSATEALPPIASAAPPTHAPTASVTTPAPIVPTTNARVPNAAAALPEPSAASVPPLASGHVTPIPETTPPKPVEKPSRVIKPSPPLHRRVHDGEPKRSRREATHARRHPEPPQATKAISHTPIGNGPPIDLSDLPSLPPLR